MEHANSVMIIQEQMKLREKVVALTNAQIELFHIRKMETSKVLVTIVQIIKEHKLTNQKNISFLLSVTQIYVILHQCWF